MSKCQHTGIQGVVTDLWSCYAYMCFTHPYHFLHCLKTKSLVQDGRPRYTYIVDHLRYPGHESQYMRCEEPANNVTLLGLRFTGSGKKQCKLRQGVSSLRYISPLFHRPLACFDTTVQTYR